MNVLKIFLLFCYFGCLCFSGGNALVPLYIDDLVEARHWMTLHEFGNLMAIAQMTPGPIGVNAATFFGFRQGGVPGALAATTGLLLPSYFLVILALRSLERWEKSRIVQGLMSGIRPATAGMILASMLIFMEMSVFSEPLPWGALLGKPVSPGFYLRPMAAGIFLVSTWLLYKGKVSIIAVILASAVLGALFCR